MSVSVEATNLRVAYGNRVVIDDLNVVFPAQKITTIIGPNGCGKSTLLRAVARLIPTKNGHVTVDGEDAGSMRRRVLAKKIGVLPQTPMAPDGIVVAELVARGRHPHQSWINQWSKSDEKEVAKALSLTHSADLAYRTLNELSGGQRQRVWISMVLAQNTDVLFLDEPTTYLDLSHSIDVLNLVSYLRTDLQRTVVMVLHDLNLAARYSDNLVLMSNGAIAATGTPESVMTPENLRDVFGLDALVVDDPATGGPMIVPNRPQHSTAGDYSA